ncbi:hypothetical protein HPB52_021662 [Rhipicephalus sanguineus]|uniref:Uncharacterized protein n=1 Tax=Rhipicephalus sanguineus TaxID=34632 RepID=A0A9D4T1Y1_RHISA|nr:hypothetical protein HPB52_021662 [Rhipicephalus sanguineus]
MVWVEPREKETQELVEDFNGDDDLSQEFSVTPLRSDDGDGETYRDLEHGVGDRDWQIKTALEEEMPGVTIRTSTVDRLLDAHSYSVKLVTQRPAERNRACGPFVPAALREDDL